MLKKLCHFILPITFLLSLTGCDAPIDDTYKDISGNTGRFSDHKGRWIIVNYWAIWCKPCIEEIPQLNEFAKINEKKAILFSVNYDGQQGDSLIQQSNKLGIKFPTLIEDPSSILGYERPTVLPTTFIFDQSGKLHKTLIGPQTQHSLEQALL